MGSGGRARGGLMRSSYRAPPEAATLSRPAVVVPLGAPQSVGTAAGHAARLLPAVLVGDVLEALWRAAVEPVALVSGTDAVAHAVPGAVQAGADEAAVAGPAHAIAGAANLIGPEDPEQADTAI